MARVRILRRQNSGYMELPKEMLGYDEVELFQLKDGYYLLTAPLEGSRGQAGKRAQGEDAREAKVPERSGVSVVRSEGGAARSEGSEARGEARSEGVVITPAERQVLKTLLAIRFEKRTPPYVAKELSEQEMFVLRELERKGFVNVFRGQKYKEGVYNIRDSIYPLLSQTGQKTGAAAAAGSAPAPGYASAAPAAAQRPSPQGSFSMLSSRGFMIINDRNEARSLSEQLASEMKSGAVVGVKGFDGKFYIVTRAYFTKAQAVLSTVLREPMDCDSIATAAKLDPDGCRAVLRLMAENGDVIEKKKGIFAPI